MGRRAAAGPGGDVDERTLQLQLGLDATAALERVVELGHADERSVQLRVAEVPPELEGALGLELVADPELLHRVLRTNAVLLQVACSPDDAHLPRELCSDHRHHRRDRAR